MHKTKQKHQNIKKFLKGESEEGKKYDIEMQLIDAVGFTDRVLYYWSKMYSSMLNRGDIYEQLRPVISIVVTRFELFPLLTDLHNVFTLSAKRPHRRPYRR